MSDNRTVKIETPDDVHRRAFHEEQVHPGAICRRYTRNDAEEWEAGDWFLVISPPKLSDHGSEYVQVLWLEGQKAGKRKQLFLGDMGVKPPYRGVTEKHDLQIPREYIADSYLARALTKFAHKVMI